MNYLMSILLDKVTFLPFGYLMDLYRWEIFDGSTKPEDYQKRWDELRLEYQVKCYETPFSRTPISKKLFFIKPRHFRVLFRQMIEHLKKPLMLLENSIYRIILRISDISFRLSFSFNFTKKCVSKPVSMIPPIHQKRPAHFTNVTFLSPKRPDQL